jgi:chaperonin GroES
MVAEVKKERKPIKLPEILPIGDRVVVRRKRASDTTPGGIVLPDAVRETKSFGEVIAVGPGALKSNRQPNESERYPLQVKVGDKVILPIGTQIIRLDEDDPDSEVCICQECQLLAIVR